MHIMYLSAMGAAVMVKGVMVKGVMVKGYNLAATIDE